MKLLEEILIISKSEHSIEFYRRQGCKMRLLRYFLGIGGFRWRVANCGYPKGEVYTD